MKLEHYDLTIIVSVPGEPGTKLSAKFEKCPRQKLIDHSSSVGNLLLTFEAWVEDIPPGATSRSTYSTPLGRKSPQKAQKKTPAGRQKLDPDP